MNSNIRWKRETSWWDQLNVPDDIAKSKGLFKWLELNAPHPLEHDYILSTDGSGCTVGWGANAAIIERVDLNYETQCREIQKEETRVIVQGTYGSTVQRSEFQAFLSGVHQILGWEIDNRSDDDTEALEFIPGNSPLRYFEAANRPTIYWLTDRANIAKSLLYGVDNKPLNSRSKELDLWSMFNAIRRYVCITPMAISRNSVDSQAAADALCSEARSIMKGHEEAFASILKSKNIYPEKSWKNKKEQKAKF